MLSVLSETHRAIVEVMTMRLHLPQALEYLKDAGHEMSRAKYFRQRKKIENMKLERMHYIAKYFPDQHLERIDRCELVEKLMWENYHQCKDQAKKVKILEIIVNIQPYLSTYYEATKMVLESTVRIPDSKDNDVVPGIDDEWRDIKSIITIGDEPKETEAKGGITSSLETKEGEQTPKNEDTEEWKELKCPNCHKSFYNNFTLSAHLCEPKPTV